MKLIIPLLDRRKVINGNHTRDFLCKVDNLPLYYKCAMHLPLRNFDEIVFPINKNDYNSALFIEFNKLFKGCNIKFILMDEENSSFSESLSLVFDKLKSDFDFICLDFRVQPIALNIEGIIKVSKADFKNVIFYNPQFDQRGTLFVRFDNKFQALEFNKTSKPGFNASYNFVYFNSSAQFYKSFHKGSDNSLFDIINDQKSNQKEFNCKPIQRILHYSANMDVNK